jgi:hypothetical protein
MPSKAPPIPPLFKVDAANLVILRASSRPPAGSTPARSYPRGDRVTPRVHHAARRRGGVAARGARAAGGDAAGWRTEFWHATVGRTVTLAKCAGCSLIVANCII